MNSKEVATPNSADKQEAVKDSIQPARQMGEGSYEGTRDYQKSIGAYLEDADVAADAKAAEPASAAEAVELKQAEQEGLSHSKSRGQ